MVFYGKNPSVGKIFLVILGTDYYVPSKIGSYEGWSYVEVLLYFLKYAQNSYSRVMQLAKFVLYLIRL